MSIEQIISDVNKLKEINNETCPFYTGALISLGHVGQIEIIEKVFGEFYIAQAFGKNCKVMSTEFDNAVKIFNGFKIMVVKIKSENSICQLL